MCITYIECTDIVTCKNKHDMTMDLGNFSKLSCETFVAAHKHTYMIWISCDASFYIPI